MKAPPVAPLRDRDLEHVDAYWRASNYLTVGQIYLRRNPLLRTPLKASDIKPRLLGHWGTTPGLNLMYAHLNRLIRQNDLEMLFITGPGHGGPAIVAQTYLEGTYSEVYPDVSCDVVGMEKLFAQFSAPGGIPSHVAPEIPGSIHEGGELGYALSHAYGAAFDNPDLIVACAVGDGEAETGPLAASWQASRFVNPARDGAVLPILHLNGYKIANPTLLARIPRSELTDLLSGAGHETIYVEGDDPVTVHRDMAKALDKALADIRCIQHIARTGSSEQPPRWPAIVLVTPKGWTGPKVVDGLPVEGTWRSHQVPLGDVRKNPESLAALEAWMQSYRPDELFDEGGRLVGDLQALVPDGDQRMGASAHANGGILRTELVLPAAEHYAIEVESGRTRAEATRVLGAFLRDVFAANAHTNNFRLFGADETASNRLGSVFEETGTTWLESQVDSDVNLAADGRVMELLSEHTLQGWIEGYLLTGRHGLFSTYEAFAHIVDSMVNQHAKWLKTTSREIRWRLPISSLNYLLTSHAWRQDHNGFSHQDPGFLDHLVNKGSRVVRLYLPPDANCLLHVARECFGTTDQINVIVAGKQNSLQYLSGDEARTHVEHGLGIWPWASSDGGQDPDVVFACAGDVPTQEALAAVHLLRDLVPHVRVRFVNVVDLLTLQSPDAYEKGLTDAEFERLFTPDAPVVFAFHGYPGLIHRLTYNRPNQRNISVQGYREEGTTTTPFDMVVRNDLDRYRLAADVIERLPNIGTKAAHALQWLRYQRSRHRHHIRMHGSDLPEVAGWEWTTEPERAMAPEIVVSAEGIADWAPGENR